MRRVTMKPPTMLMVAISTEIPASTTTTPFDMLVRNDLDRFHLVQDVVDRVPKLRPQAGYIKQAVRDKLIFSARVELVPAGDLPRYEYKAKLVEKAYED